MSENKTVLGKAEISHAVGKLTGERGLLTAVMSTAYKDIHYGKPDDRLDALTYFASGTFQQHADAIGIPDADKLTLRQLLAHGKEL